MVAPAVVAVDDWSVEAASAELPGIIDSDGWPLIGSTGTTVRQALEKTARETRAVRVMIFMGLVLDSGTGGQLTRH